MNKALNIDFTGQLAGARHCKSFGEEVMHLIRNADKPTVVTIIDRGYGLSQSKVGLVQDHINLHGSNPLVGPNHPSGPRFPPIANVYITDFDQALPKVITAGLKAGVQPTSAEKSALKEVGADCWCYNLVPAMIVAAHAGLKVLGILVPEGAEIDPQLQAKLLRAAT